MPAPNQGYRKTTIAVSRRTTRSSTCNKLSTNDVTKGKNTTLGLKKETVVSSKNENAQDALNKRKAEKSPFSDKMLKRSAFGDITNAIDKKANADTKKVIKKPVQASVINKAKQVVKIPTVTSTSTITSGLLKKQSVALQKNDKQTEKTKQNVVKKTILTRKKELETNAQVNINTNKPDIKISKPEIVLKKVLSPSSIKPVTKESIQLSEIATTSSGEDSSLYVSALEELNISDDRQQKDLSKESPGPPPGVDNFDKENWDDPHQVSHYAFDIFEYLKSREAHYTMTEYMEKQTALTRYMRSLLVDWMVEVQESFELTHETLYLGVKIVDKFLSKVIIDKDTLQLVGATSLFIASKFEERSPPLLEDVVYIGDKAYTDEKVIEMEITILKNLNFDMGFPLSYRFLRRYARCSKTPMSLLTLARFILEYCIMDYSTIMLSDSKVAASALHIARIMKKVGSWTPTLEYYSGYKLQEFKEIAIQMNEVLHKKPRSTLSTIRNKYSHEVFFAVAKTPLVSNEEL
ncbi:cyclin B3 [Lycorma delicatula]|uniref:cyclin B3 n=1 Tax=Lycorma delicatula TaxID=130591 RepID=UPI003F51A43E